MTERFVLRNVKTCRWEEIDIVIENNKNRTGDESRCWRGWKGS